MKEDPEGKAVGYLYAIARPVEGPFYLMLCKHQHKHKPAYSYEKLCLIECAQKRAPHLCAWQLEVCRKHKDMILKELNDWGIMPRKWLREL